MSLPALEITAVICAYTEKRWDQLVAAVSSLQAQSVAPQELIIVIDHNSALYDHARHTFAGVTIVENTEQKGLSGARNTAIRIARGNIIAFMDEDAVASRDWIATLTRMYADNHIIGVGGAILPIWQTGKPAWFPDEFLWVVGCTYKGMPESPTQVRNMIGCNMSFRSSVFSTVGNFRNDIGRVGTRPVGCEETELCIRARQSSTEAQIIYEPRAIVHHHVPAARSTWAYYRSRCYSEGMSKALVSRYVGTRDGLASERTYALQTLPSAILHDVADTFDKRSLNGLRQAGAIVLGLLFTGTGYIAGSLTLSAGNLIQRLDRRAAASQPQTPRLGK